MGRHDAKRFDAKDNKRNKKKLKLGKLVFILLLLIAIAFIIMNFKNFSFDFLKAKNNSSENQSEQNLNSVSLSNLLSAEVDSKFESRKIANTNLTINNLFLKYENNVTVIEFEIYNNASTAQSIFDFTFSLVDENNIEIIDYTLSSEDAIPANDKKKFVLIASRDVSNATDFEINIK